MNPATALLSVTGWSHALADGCKECVRHAFQNAEAPFKKGMLLGQSGQATALQLAI